MGRFIPSFHFIPAEQKLSREFCSEVVGYYYFNHSLRNLLDGKKVDEIDGYASGNYDLTPFKRIFRSLRKQQIAANNNNIEKRTVDNMDTTGLQWSTVPLIPPKLNAAIHTIQKIPIEVSATCQDPLAVKKRDEDLEFLKNRQKMVETIQPLYDSMNLGEVDMGATKHSSVPFTALPLDLDLNNEDEFRIFANLIYNLAPESAIESVLQQFYDIKKADQVKMLKIKDHLRYGVAVTQLRPDKITGLPNIEYLHPDMVRTDGGVLPDYSDRIATCIDYLVTPLELFNYFPDEICDVDFLEKIINYSGPKGDWDNGYCSCNSVGRQDKNNWNTFKLNLKYFEVKSVDSLMIAQKPKSKYKYFTDDETKCTERVWAQNTYCFYWLVNTKWFFGINRLPYAYRSEGNETFQNFSTNIYRSQEKSAVELSIGENKKAQIADIKLQHTIIMSAPSGKIIDLKYIRNVVEGLTQEADKYTVKELLDMAIEQGIHLIDTDGYEGKNTNQFVPVKELPGGLKEDILGYYKVILEATQNIAKYTSINDQLTGQSINPEGLVGLQKLLINSSINSLRYVNEALTTQYQAIFNIWANYIQEAIKKGGAAKQAIVDMIGKNKVELIEGLNEIPLHRIGIKISLGQREEERAIFKSEIAQMRKDQKINAADEYYILNTPNPRDAMWLVAVAENKFLKRQDKARQEQLAAGQKIAEQQGQNMVQNTQAQTEGKIQQIQASGNVEAELMKLANQLGLNAEQLKGLIKRQLQRERMDGQVDKSVKTIYAKSNAEQQSALA